ncbi:MAG TPA: tRNA (adenosine(37)-N6)-threonylcarbamoyltransferase complex transferase subunit TsaD [Candidatus Portnoybacteria bacterium]|nr:tRNA (adenosine(37)-N6)-threonylcarbamoyltransferase complex transferase subunit TsaD [Candidatus Portnoybacteria bacterium]
MFILSIETSCDDTGVAILNADKRKQETKILVNLISSQIKIHSPYGGVVPSLAKREHQKNLVPLLKKSLKRVKMLNPRRGNIPKEKIAQLKQILNREPELLDALIDFLIKYQKPKINYLSVTVGPGLEPSLWVGINFIKALGFFWQCPIIPINHLEGHLFSSFLNDDGRAPIIINQKQFPFLGLIISGGHTELVQVKGIGKYKVIGQTRDDAAGEAFDKVARLLKLEYPGGEKIARLAQGVDLSDVKVSLPRPMINSTDLDFSFSGLKTAVYYLIKKNPELVQQKRKIIAAEFQQAVVDVLIKKTKRALEKDLYKKIILGGGVSANQLLRQELVKVFGDKVVFPQLKYCSDNGAMIALVTWYRLNKFGDKIVKSPQYLRAKGNWEIGK